MIIDSTPIKGKRIIIQSKMLNQLHISHIDIPYCIGAIMAAANFTTYILTKLYHFSYIYLNLYTGFYYFTYLRRFLHSFKEVFIYVISVLSLSFKDTG